MSFLFYLFAVLLAGILLSVLFLRADAARIAGGLRLAGPLTLGALGLVLLFAGRAGLGGVLISLAAAWYGAAQRRRRARPSPGSRSSVRTAALEMELDHDTGALEGMVLAGKFEGRELSQLSEAELLVLHEELGGDVESLQLLETYLDGRFPVWREHAKPHVGGGQGGAPASGTMTKEEAYKILGLEAGAAAADIRKAHRRLMQRLHPDIGGTSFLAARINEAKDILLSDQD